MLCGVQLGINKKVLARNVIKNNGPFQCPACKSEVIVRKGNIKIHHFAHKPPYNCHHGHGETEAHRKCKEEIYNVLSKIHNVSELDMEHDFGSAVADVFCRINGQPIALEIQRSDLSVNNITERTLTYASLGVFVLWIALFNDKLRGAKYSPKAWEKWLHATYYGRVYYWLSGEKLLPVHFSKYNLHVKETSWYNEYAEEQHAGGHSYPSRRYKTPKYGTEVNITSDFSPTIKPAWSRGTVSIPKCQIYQDKQQKWW